MLSEGFNAKVAEVSPLSTLMCYEKTAGPGVQSGPFAEGGFRGSHPAVTEQPRDGHASEAV